MTEQQQPTRLQRAWDAWLDSTDDTDGTTTELGDALAELLNDATINEAEAERIQRIQRVLLQFDG